MAAQADTRPKLTRTALAVALAVLAGLLRLIDHPWNFTAMGAIGIFAGARMRGVWSFAVPLLVRAGTDVILSQKYEGFPVFDPFVYGSYVVCVLLGWTLRRSRSPVRILSAGIASSIVFFVVTNFGAWVLWPETYPDRSWRGIIQSYEAGLLFYRGPLEFFRGVFLGDLIFTPILFGLHAGLVRLFAGSEEARSLAVGNGQ